MIWLHDKASSAGRKPFPFQKQVRRRESFAFAGFGGGAGETWRTTANDGESARPRQVGAARLPHDQPGGEGEGPRRGGGTGNSAPAGRSGRARRLRQLGAPHPGAPVGADRFWAAAG